MAKTKKSELKSRKQYSMDELVKSIRNKYPKASTSKGKSTYGMGKKRYTF